MIYLAAAIGVFLSYAFRYRVEEVYNFFEYLYFEWWAFVKGAIGAAGVLLLWTYISTVLGWVGVSIEWPALDWKLAAVVGFAGRKIYEMAPQGFKYILNILGKKFQ
jgi:hypothetical protein